MKPGTRTPGRKKWWLTAFLISPVLVVALLLYLIDGSIRQGTELAAPPIGAGAGRTGMANEFMGARRPAQDPTADAEPADERGIVPDDAPDSTAGGTPAAAPDQPPAPPEAASPAPRLVRPETLPQGFVLVVEDITRQASDAEPIYLASSWNGWDPKDPQRQLERRSTASGRSCSARPSRTLRRSPSSSRWAGGTARSWAPTPSRWPTACSRPSMPRASHPASAR